jgi:hypothetical protein
MTAVELEALLRYVALPPLTLALRERYLKVPRHDPAAAAIVVAEELAIVDRARARLLRAAVASRWCRRPITTTR